MKMASIAGGTASQAARITDRTRSMFRAILAENGIANTDDAVRCGKLLQPPHIS
jgi:hypothetical protein